MKIFIFCLAPILAAAADSSATGQMFDHKLSPTRRVTACFELRGNHDEDVLRAMTRAVEDPDLLSCAATNLRIAGSVEALAQALASSQNEQVRATAARELGSFQKPELLDALSRAALEENALVATNALAGLNQYQDASVVPYLVTLAQRGGIVGDMALERLSQLDPPATLRVARDLLKSGQVPDRLYAMRAIGSFGDASDVANLKKIAAENPENISQRGRGFGLMPPINLSRAAQAAIAGIESRQN
jgi:HEAT repeat protein